MRLQILLGCIARSLRRRGSRSLGCASLQGRPARLRRARRLRLLAALAVLSAGVAHADPAAQARALFDQGRALVDDGEYAKACPKLAESVRLDPKLISRFALASCYERLGKTASAWAEYKQVAAAANKAGESEWQREMFALDRVKVLEKKLVKLTVNPSKPLVPGLVIRRNETPVPPDEYGAAVPVDPGELVVTASAVGYATWSEKLVIGKQAATMTVVVPVLQKAEPPKAPPPEAAPPPPPPPETPPPPPPPQS